MQQWQQNVCLENLFLTVKEKKTLKKVIKSTMKAVVGTKYGPPEVLRIERVQKPVPKDDEILIKIMASSVNSGDVRVRGLVVEGFLLPAISMSTLLLTVAFLRKNNFYCWKMKG